MQQQELQIKAQDVQRKTQKDQADIALKQQQLQVERERIQSHETLESTKAGIKMSYDKDKLDRNVELDSVRTWVDMAHKKEQSANQKRQIAAQLMAAQMNSRNNKKGEE